MNIKIWAVNHFQCRYPFRCLAVLHFEGLHRSFAVGVGGYLDGVAGAAVAVDDDAEEPSRLRAYSCQELQNLAPLRLP